MGRRTHSLLLALGMHYTVTAQDKDGGTVWTTQVPATSFDTAVSIVTRRGGMAGVHSLLVTKG